MFIPVFYIITSYIAITSAGIVKREKYDPRTFSSCFENIGCVDYTDKWYDKVYRPKNLEPLDRHTIRTEFLLMKNPKNETNDLVYDIMNLKKETVAVAGFKTGTCTIFVFHDFTSNGYTGWIKHLVVAVSRRTDCNVISVDWQAGAEPPFEQAIANARVVALEAKAFITLLKKCFNQSLDAIHLIGHGVGAHIAGYIGKHICGIQRITGLDPTGPFFERMPKEVRLDADDAKYVEVIHTDSFNHRSQGGKISLGHADFIINNAGHQPGCNDSSHMPAFMDIHRDALQEGKILAACSHKRAFKYFIQALEDTDCHFIGLKCESYKKFLEGKCNNCGAMGKDNKYTDCATFGLEEASVTTKNNTYYLLSFGKKPFCMHTYTVNVTINRSDSVKESEGYFEFIFVDNEDKVTNASTGNPELLQGMKFSSGHSYSFIVYGTSPHIDKIKEAKVKWNFKSKKICIMCDKAIAVQDISIRRLSMSTQNLPNNLLCPLHPNSELKNSDYVQFQTCESMYGPDYERNGHIKPSPSATAGAMKGANGTTINIGNSTNRSSCEHIRRANPAVDLINVVAREASKKFARNDAEACSGFNISDLSNYTDVNSTDCSSSNSSDITANTTDLTANTTDFTANTTDLTANTTDLTANATTSFDFANCDALKTDKSDGCSSSVSKLNISQTTARSITTIETTTISKEDKDCAKMKSDVKQFKDCFDSNAFDTPPDSDVECNPTDKTTSTKKSAEENEVLGL